MKSTCVLVIFFAVFYAATAEHSYHSGHGKGPRKFGKAKENCTQLDEFKDMDINALRGMWHEGKEIEDQTMKCFFKCIAEEIGSMNKETGEIQVPKPKLENNMSTGRTDWVKIISDCKTLTENEGYVDLCDKAYKFQKCVQKKKPPKGDYHNKHLH